MNSRLTGILGEEAAAKEYRRRGYTLLEANFRTRQGEIDLIAEKDGCIVFIEVKTRRPGSVVSGAQAVTFAKQRRLIAAAGAFIARRGEEPAAMRFDVVEILCENGRIKSIRCIENAFDAC